MYYAIVMDLFMSVFIPFCEPYSRSGGLAVICPDAVHRYPHLVAYPNAASSISISEILGKPSIAVNATHFQPNVVDNIVGFAIEVRNAEMSHSTVDVNQASRSGSP
jgi:hypothetical protein